ncbi:MAG: cytochrome c biogenesis protein CcsA [Deltaproteobacteria bacterium]|nr:cytochrome c biogenesis protein CcsA [Deltaproteobacteria bacterium]
MFLHVIMSHFCLLNFAVAAALSFQSARSDSVLRGSLAKVAQVLFVLGAVSASVACASYALLPELVFVSARWLILVAFLSWLVIIIRFWLRISGLLAYASLLMAVFVLFQFLSSAPGGGLYDVDSPQLYLAFHIAGATMGQLLALLASLVAVLYLWQQRLLKKKLLEQLTSRIPALDLLETILIAVLWAGFFFLTAALISGAVYFCWYFDGSMQIYGRKITWALTVWSCYFLALLARHWFHVPFKRIAQISLIGFCLLLITFFGLSFYQGGG